MPNAIKKRKTVEKAVHLDGFKAKYLSNDEVAVMYLNEALARNDVVFFRECLLEVIKIHGGVSVLARKLSVSRQNIHQILSEKGGLKIETINKYLGHVNLRLKVEKVV